MEPNEKQQIIFRLLSILFLVLVASVMSPSFRTLDNFATIIRQSSTLIVLSTRA